MTKFTSIILSLFLILTSSLPVLAVDPDAITPETPVLNEAEAETAEPAPETVPAEETVTEERSAEPLQEKTPAEPEAEAEGTSVSIVHSAEELAEAAQAADAESFFTIDVRKPCEELATEALTNDVREAQTGSAKAPEKQEEIIDILEDSDYYIANQLGTTRVDVTSLYSNRRIRLDAEFQENLDAYGAKEAVFYEDHYYLTYESEEDTKKAYDALIKEYGALRVTLDIPVRLSETNWGTTHMKMDQEIQEMSEGSPVTVAILDTGIAEDHEVFSNTTIKDGRNFVDQSMTTDTTDDSGHGTAVAGIVAEATPSSVSILPVKILDENGEGSVLNVLSGLEYALENGADIVNISLGAFAKTETQFEQLQTRFSESMSKGNALVICASGNEGADLDEEGVYQFPSELTNVVSVGAFDEDEDICAFSNYGSAVDYAAPGDYLRAADSSDGSYTYMSGTSFASPFIAAAAAIIKTEDDSLSPDGIEAKLDEIAVDMGEDGRDVYFGKGCPVFGSEGSDDPTTDPVVNPEPADISEAEIIISGDFTYNGREICPDAEVWHNGTLLEKGTDYNISYSDNINAGTATITVSGTRNYTGTAVQTFEIKPKQITPEVILSKSEFIYTGLTQSPEVAVKYENAFLVNNRDYTVSGASGKNAGTYFAEITMKGNYSGHASAAFEIAPKQITPTLTLSETSYVYDGKVKTPSVTVKNASRILSASEYDVTYDEGRIAAGTYTVAVSLKGNYTGAASSSFVITPDASVPVMKLSETTYVYDGRKKYPQAIVTAGSKELKQGTDYDLKYPDLKADAGTYTVMAALKGNYSGIASAKFTITPKQVAPEIKLSATDFKYDGKEKRPAVTVTAGSVSLSAEKDYTLSYTGNVVNSGTVTVKAQLKGNYAGDAAATYVIRKADNTLSAFGKIYTIKYTTLRKKTQQVKRAKLIRKTGGNGTITYTKLRGNRKITINKKTGELTVKKGLPKGTYKIRINVFASGDRNHSMGSRVVTCRIRIR